MSHLVFPNDRLSYRYDAVEQRVFSSAGARVRVFEDEGLTTPARIQLHDAATPLPDNVIAVGVDSLIPEFMEISGRELETLWALAEGTTAPYRMDSRLADRMAAVETVVAPKGMLRAPRVHVQTQPATVWSWTHELGYDPPSVLVRDTDGRVWMAEVDYPIAGQSIRVLFDDPMAGTAAYK